MKSEYRKGVFTGKILLSKASICIISRQTCGVTFRYLFLTSRLLTANILFSLVYRMKTTLNIIAREGFSSTRRYYAALHQFLQQDTNGIPYSFDKLVLRIC